MLKLSNFPSARDKLLYDFKYSIFSYPGKKMRDHGVSSIMTPLACLHTSSNSFHLKRRHFPRQSSDPKVSLSTFPKKRGAWDRGCRLGTIGRVATAWAPVSMTGIQIYPNFQNLFDQQLDGPNTLALKLSYLNYLKLNNRK